MYSLSAFRTYDIRGIRQQDIDEEFGARLGYVLWQHMLSKVDRPRILIVWDVRLANNILIEETLKWFASAGIEQVEVYGRDERFPAYPYGICSTSMAYHLWLWEMDYTIIFSASHNTSEYVGMKIVDREMKYIKTADLKRMFEQWEDAVIWDEIPTIISHDTDKMNTLFADMHQRFSSLYSSDTSLPKITFDYSNGAWVHYEQDFLTQDTLDVDHFVHINNVPDSNFSNHESDTSRFANYEQLISEIQTNGSDFWFMFDGDVDRIWMCLPNGRVVTGDVILAIIAKQLLESGKADELWSREIFQEVFCSRVIRDIVDKYNGNLHIVRVWRWAFVDEVIEKNGLIAGETSAHILFKEYGTIEVPLLALYYIIKEVQNFDSAQDMIETYMPYVRDQILHFACDDKDAVIQAVKEKYAEYPQLTIDGVRVEWPDRRFTVRKSGTEPVIKVWLEWETQEIYDRVLWEIKGFLESLGAEEEL